MVAEVGINMIKINNIKGLGIDGYSSLSERQQLEILRRIKSLLNEMAIKADVSLEGDLK